MDADDERLLSGLDLEGIISTNDLRDLGLAPSREPSGYPDPGGALVPRHDPSLNTLLNPYAQGPPQSQLTPAPPGPGTAPTDSHVKSFDNLRLVIQSHSVHKVENPDTEDREYVVSNLRTFNIEVVLVNEHNELAVDVNLGLVTSLLYENGLVVQRPNDQEQLLTGETEVVIIGGTGKFVLKMGPSVLSSKMGKQRFRIKIEPKNERIRQEFPQLTVLTEPLKSVTKLDRKPPPPGSRVGASAPPPPMEPAIPMQPPIPHPAAAARPAGPGGADWYQPPAPVPRGPLGQPVAMASQFLDDSRVIPAATSTADGMEARLRAELDSERTERSMMEEKLRMQREQIAELTKSNTVILEELGRLRNHLNPGGGNTPGSDAKRGR